MIERNALTVIDGDAEPFSCFMLLLADDFFRAEKPAFADCYCRASRMAEHLGYAIPKKRNARKLLLTVAQDLVAK